MSMLEATWQDLTLQSSGKKDLSHANRPKHTSTQSHRAIRHAFARFCRLDQPGEFVRYHVIVQSRLAHRGR